MHISSILSKKAHIILFFILSVTPTLHTMAPDRAASERPTISPKIAAVPQKALETTLTQEPEKKKKSEEASRTHKPSKKRCVDEPTGSANVSGICYLNATLQLVYKICCDDEVWAYINKVYLRPSHRLAPLRKAVLNFINHYHEPRTRWNEAKNEYEALSGQKWVDAVTLAITKLDPSRLGLAGGGQEYFALLHILESLVGSAVNMNFVLKQTKNFNPPVGIFLSTTLYKYGPRNLEDQAVLDKFTKQFSTEPGETWLERCLAFQARTERMIYKESVWPKFLIIVNFESPDPDKPSQSPEYVKELTDRSQEEHAFFELTSQFASFPLGLSLKHIGLTNDVVTYNCCGFALSTINHVTAVINYGETWHWCNDEKIISGSEAESVVSDARTGALILDEETTPSGEYFPKELYANTLYVYKKFSYYESFSYKPGSL